MKSMKYKKILITGGLGFIGSHFVDLILNYGLKDIIVLDKYTYAASEKNLINFPKESIIRGDICNTDLVRSILQKYDIELIVNFAAESHVDNSITGPSDFIQTNIVGVSSLLTSAHEQYLRNKNFLFVQISTDEVFGSLGKEGFFNEKSAYNPSSPYSSSKASADHLVMAWHRTYGLPTIITHCSNNYGPRQHIEKLIPKTITNMLAGKNVPIYGNGQNVRDWIHVKDHCYGIFLAITEGKIGERYCFGGKCEMNNIDLVNLIADRLTLRHPERNFKELIEFSQDRLGHDFRYAIDDAKAVRDLGFARGYRSMYNAIDDVIDSYAMTSST